MRIVEYSCPTCGYKFGYPLEKTTFPCIACGKIHGRPKAAGESLACLERANELRVRCEFVKAEAAYNRVLEQYPDEHSARWGLVLCKYGVEVKEGKLTIHFYNPDDVLSDPDYKRACELAEEETRSLYEEQGKYLHDIQEEVRKIQTEPWDIFLCYKKSGREKGTEAPEFKYADKLYKMLLKKQYRVFFAEETLDGKRGADFEAQIFHALYSAPVMLLVCSDPENLATPWVHSEWSRYLERPELKVDKCRLIPILCDACTVNDLPGGLNGKQCLRFGEIDWFGSLITSMDEVLKDRNHSAADPEVQERLGGILYRMAEHNWDAAYTQADELISRHSSCAVAYLYKLLAKKHMLKPDELRRCMDPFEQSLDWEWAMRYANDRERAEWQGILDDSREARRREEERESREWEAKRKKWDELKTQAEVALKERSFAAAAVAADKMMELRPELPVGYLLRLAADLYLRDVADLRGSLVAFEEKQLWKDAYQRADTSMKSLMSGWVKDSQEARRQERLDRERQESDRLEQESREREQKLADLKRDAEAALHERNWALAKRLADELISECFEDYRGYLLRLLAEYGLPYPERLAELETAFENSRNWQDAYRRANASQKAEMDTWLNASRELRRRQAEAAHARALQKKVDNARGLLSLGKWDEAAEVCRTLENYPERELLQHMAAQQIPNDDGLINAPEAWFAEAWWMKTLAAVSKDRRERLETLQRAAEAECERQRRRQVWRIPALTLALMAVAALACKFLGIFSVLAIIAAVVVLVVCAVESYRNSSGAGLLWNAYVLICIGVGGVFVVASMGVHGAPMLCFVASFLPLWFFGLPKKRYFLAPAVGMLIMAFITMMSHPSVLYGVEDGAAMLNDPAVLAAQAFFPVIYVLPFAAALINLLIGRREAQRSPAAGQ